MNKHKFFAAAVAGLLVSGAAFAEGEDHIDYTGQQLSSSRAEVVAETRSFNAMHRDFLARSNEAYGSFDPAASVWSPSENNGRVARGVNSPIGNFRVDETYGGFPMVDARPSRGE